jgi:hypothetical protein
MRMTAKGKDKKMAEAVRTYLLSCHHRHSTSDVLRIGDKTKCESCNDQASVVGLSGEMWSDVTLVPVNGGIK